MLFYMSVIGHSASKRFQPAFPVGRKAACHNQAGIAFGSFCIKGGQFFKAVFFFFQIGVHGTH
jgi:hypothetical protein